MAAEEEEKSRLKQRGHNNTSYAGGECTKAAARGDTQSTPASSLSVGARVGKRHRMTLREGRRIAGGADFALSTITSPLQHPRSSFALHPAFEMTAAVKYRCRFSSFFNSDFSKEDSSHSFAKYRRPVAGGAQ